MHSSFFIHSLFVKHALFELLSALALSFKIRTFVCLQKRSHCGPNLLKPISPKTLTQGISVHLS